MSATRDLGRLACVLFATACSAPAQSWSSGNLLAADELALNFAAGPRSKQIYKDLLSFDEDGARMDLGVQLDAMRYGAVVEGRRPNSFAVAFVERELGQQYRAQVLIEATIVEVNQNALLGFERDLFGSSGQLQDFVSALASPNHAAGGFTVSVNRNGSFVGTTQVIPNTSCVFLSFEQTSNEFRVFARGETGGAMLLYTDTGTQPSGTQVSFGAARLDRGESAAFSNLYLQGEVNGANEQVALEDVDSILCTLEDARLDLLQLPPNQVQLELHLTEVSDDARALGVDLANLMQMPGALQATTLGRRALQSVGKLERATTSLLSGIQRRGTVDVERTIPRLADIPVLGYLFQAQMRGMNARSDRDLVVLVRPTIILP